MGMRDLTIIGERINPGFKSSKALFDDSDIAGIQALAIKQVDAGASYLNVNVGARALNDDAFMREVIVAIQEAVAVPLSFDFPSFEVQEICLNAYDEDKAGRKKPIINSIAESRWNMAEALRIRPCRVVVMASERVENGKAAANKEPGQVLEVSKRLADRLTEEYGLSLDDIILDVSIATLATDREGLIEMALDGIKLIGQDPDLRGIHMMGGISNIGMMLPSLATDGQPLKTRLERAFMTLARPYGFDMILATPWHCYEPLPGDDFVLNLFKEVIQMKELDAVRHTRKLYS
jgi:cobalamin-dependent methionine synthase I